MRRPFTAFLISTIFLCLSCSSEDEQQQIVQIIPQPSQLEMFPGTYTITTNTTLFFDEEFSQSGNFLKDYLTKGSTISLALKSREEADIVITKDQTLPEEGYELKISKQNIFITASDPDGAFWGVQSLRQLLPEQIENTTQNSPLSSIEVPLTEIKDAPKFKYRGMHLDVGRHFFDVAFIKEYISYLSMLKMNYFHWHLTEDQGWRIEIKQYPDLTRKGAYRKETLLGHYNETPQKFDGKRYGGFYTQDDVKEIVSFAEKMNVTIIPEIEMPGHAQAAISAYPELGCTAEQVPVATKWGVFEHIYCPNQKTFAFLKNVLTEVIDLFPGEYIHIGGDEAPKAQWEKCDHCQKLIADLHLADESELQSYFIKEIESFLNSKGKKLIGWDEILEGGLAPNATVMSWRGFDGAIEAAKQDHDVIMTPTSHAYFDYYQATHNDEPLAIGGYLPLKKVYSFNPVPDEIPSEKQHHILGAQGNIWTEYMPTSDQVEYMAFPRILALSEVVWKGPSSNIEGDYPNFLKKVERFFPRLEALGINYANHLYDVSGKVRADKEKLTYSLSSEIGNKPIVYRINNGEEELYSQPIVIDKNATIKARVQLDASLEARTFEESILFHKGTVGSISINKEPHPAYSSGGKQGLIDGILGSDQRYGDDQWLGFWGEDIQISIEFPQPTEIKNVSTRFYNANGQWIYSPLQWRIRLIHEDGTAVELQDQLAPTLGAPIVLAEIESSVPTENITKIVIEVPNFGEIPPGLQGAGNKAWTFIDEIVIQ